MDISVVRSDGSRMSMGVEPDDTIKDIKKMAVRWCGEEKQVVCNIIVYTFIFDHHCKFFHRHKAKKAMKAMKATKTKRAMKAKKAMRIGLDLRLDRLDPHTHTHLEFITYRCQQNTKSTVQLKLFRRNPVSSPKPVHERRRATGQNHGAMMGKFA